jgi:hypothetical protein
MGMGVKSARDLFAPKMMKKSLAEKRTVNCPYEKGDENCTVT